MTTCVMCERHCAGVVLDRAVGVVPRAFSFAGPGAKRLAVVFGEPGGLSGRGDETSTRERRLFAEQRTPSDLLMAVNDFTGECFRTGTWDGRTNRFHRYVTQLLSETLGSIERAMEMCYFTNLTKCEKNEQTGIPSSTRWTCFSAYLREEIRILRPRAALLFGDNAGAFAAQIEALGPRVIRAHHPSARPPAWLREPARSDLIQRIRAATDEATVASPDPNGETRPDATSVTTAAVRLVGPPMTGPGHRLWIRQYLDRLIDHPPPGTTATATTHQGRSGVLIRGGPIRLDLWAYEDYIRVGIHSTDRRVCDAIRSIPGFQVTKDAKAWFTGKILDSRGTVAIDRLVRGVG